MAAPERPARKKRVAAAKARSAFGRASSSSRDDKLISAEIIMPFRPRLAARDSSRD